MHKPKEADKRKYENRRERESKRARERKRSTGLTCPDCEARQSVCRGWQLLSVVQSRVKSKDTMTRVSKEYKSRTGGQRTQKLLARVR